MPEAFNLTNSIIGEVEQSLTTGDVETTDATASPQDNLGTPLDSDQPVDATAVDGDASLNENTADEGKKLPTTVPYEEFQKRNNTLQGRIDEQSRELEAARKGFESHAQFQQYDELAKQQTNPHTGLPFTGIDEYQAVQSAIQAENARRAEFEQQQEQQREQYIADYGVQIGQTMADLQQRADQAAFEARQAVVMNHRMENERALAEFESEFKDTEAKIVPRLRNHLLVQPPNVAKGILDDMRATFSPLKLTPEKQKALDEAAVQKYRGLKAQDKERVGATPETDGGQPVHPGQKQDLAAIARMGMSKILNIR